MRLHLTSLFTLTLLLCALAVPQREVAFGGGDGGSSDPPIGAPADLPPLNGGPTLGGSGPILVLLAVEAEGPHARGRLALVRVSGEVVDAAWLRPGRPARLEVPASGAQLDVVGTGALGVPVVPGAAARVVPGSAP